ncbi:type II 3-dehydroquinate dehydratase [Xanthobacter autotrophicus DSM 431]|uniref:type II 3-dehydroquinate dehydratase n=1 Tax=Xanthobacter nonsaccharivorans TaxID=3119912 RepID=UPI00372B5482
MIRLLLIQGANMEWLGRRQPELYGTITAAELDAMLLTEAEARGIALDTRYTNLEGEAISWIYAAAREEIDGILINPAGFLYAGYALRDCLRGVTVPIIEIHVTNIERRGMHSVTAEAALGYIAGLGLNSYFVALDAMLRHLIQCTGTRKSVSAGPGPDTDGG